MAIFHCHARTGSKSKGQSGKAKCDYNFRQGKYEAHGEKPVFCFSGNMPGFGQEDSRKYWEAADIYERSNGRIFKEIEFALPRELNCEQQQALALDIASNICGDRLPYSLAGHSGKNNPHIHLMISERENDKLERSPDQWFKRYNRKSPGKGGAKKTAVLKPKSWLEHIRELIAIKTNEHLARAGIDKKIDHRSYEDQGSSQVPGKHLGPTAVAFEERTKQKSDRRLYIESLWEDIRDKKKKMQLGTKKLMLSIAGQVKQSGEKKDCQNKDVKIANKKKESNMEGQQKPTSSKEMDYENFSLKS